MNLRTLLPFPLLVALAPLAAQDKLHTLTLHPKAGTKLHYAAHNESSSDIDMAGQAMSMSHNLDRTFAIEVVAVEKDGKLKLKVTFENARGKFGLPMGGELEYDSTKKPEGGDDAGMPGMPSAALAHEFFSSILGKPFEATVSPDGQDLKIVGLEDTIDAALKKAGPGGQMLGSAMNAGMVKREIDLALARYPAKPVAVGATWEAKIQDPARKNRPTTTVLATWKLEKCEADASLLSMTGKMTKEASKDGAEDDASAKMRIENGKVEGSSNVTSADGLATKSVIKLQADIFLPNPMGGDGEMKISQKVALTVERAGGAAAKDPKKDAQEAPKKDGAPAKK